MNIVLVPAIAVAYPTLGNGPNGPDGPRALIQNTARHSHLHYPEFSSPLEGFDPAMLIAQVPRYDTQ
jgi:hypothetical protein